MDYKCVALLFTSIYQAFHRHSGKQLSGRFSNIVLGRVMGEIDDGTQGRSTPSEQSDTAEESLWLTLEGTGALLENLSLAKELNKTDDSFWLVLEGAKALLENEGQEGNLPATLSATLDCLPPLSISSDPFESNESQESNSQYATIDRHGTTDSVGLRPYHFVRFQQAIEDANGESIVDLMNDLSTEELIELVRSMDRKLQSGGQQDVHLSVDPFDRLVFFDDTTNKGFAIEASGMCQRVSRFYDDSLRYGAKTPMDQATRPSLATFTTRIAPGLA